jgi:hypothetical protein
MIRAVLKKGKIQPLDELPKFWHDGQELIVESCEPSDNPAAIKKWYREFSALSRAIPAKDHKRMAAALDEQDREAKEQVRREMGPS